MEFIGLVGSTNACRGSGFKQKKCRTQEHIGHGEGWDGDRNEEFSTKYVFKLSNMAFLDLKKKKKKKKKTRKPKKSIEGKKKKNKGSK